MVIEIVVISRATGNKIPNIKHQITNKSQIPKINDQNIDYNRIIS